MVVSWWLKGIEWELPSGKLLHNYMEKHSPFLMGKLTSSTGSCSIAMLNFQRVHVLDCFVYVSVSSTCIILFLF